MVALVVRERRRLCAEMRCAVSRWWFGIAASAFQVTLAAADDARHEVQGLTGVQSMP